MAAWAGPMAEKASSFCQALCSETNQLSLSGSIFLLFAEMITDTASLAHIKGKMTFISSADKGQTW